MRRKLSACIWCAWGDVSSGTYVSGCVVRGIRLADAEEAGEPGVVEIADA